MDVKTDWAVRYDIDGNYIGDYFSANDYNRIKSNLGEVHALALELYPAFSIPQIPDVTEADFYFETTINALERTIDAIRNATFDPGLPSTKIWYGNDYAPTFTDYNRIESCCLKMHDILERQKESKYTLAFTLGGVQF